VETLGASGGAAKADDARTSDATATATNNAPNLIRKLLS
jgi:hypothetical protein